MDKSLLIERINYWEEIAKENRTSLKKEVTPELLNDRRWLNTMLEELYCLTNGTKRDFL